eukprot:1145173-Pelagomonas_calceolata.AAC.2
MVVLFEPLDRPVALHYGRQGVRAPSQNVWQQPVEPLCLSLALPLKSEGHGNPVPCRGERAVLPSTIACFVGVGISVSGLHPFFSHEKPQCKLQLNWTYLGAVTVACMEQGAHIHTAINIAYTAQIKPFVTKTMHLTKLAAFPSAHTQTFLQDFLPLRLFGCHPHGKAAAILRVIRSRWGLTSDQGPVRPPFYVDAAAGRSAACCVHS